MQYLGTLLLFFPYMVAAVVFINYIRRPKRPKCHERADLYMEGKYNSDEHLKY